MRAWWEGTGTYDCDIQDRRDQERREEYQRKKRSRAAKKGWRRRRALAISKPTIANGR
jgi:hypothetical protein